MKKTKTLLLTVATALLTACGGGSGLSSEDNALIDEAKKGFLGEGSGEMLTLMAEVDSLSAQHKQLVQSEAIQAFNHGDESFSQVEIEKVMDQIRDLEQQIEAKCKELDQVAHAYEAQAGDLVIEAEVAEGVPLKVLTPFQAQELNWHDCDGGGLGLFPVCHRGSFFLKMTGMVELTEERPRITDWRRQPEDYYAVKLVRMKADGEVIDTISPVITLNSNSGAFNAGEQFDAHFSFGTQPIENGQSDRTRNLRHLATKKVLVIWEHPVQDKSADVVTGDLGIFELRGPVKEVHWKTYGDTWTLFFNEQAQWTGERGRGTFSNFPKVKRDNQGRIVKLSDNYDEQRMTFTYNEQGLVVRETVEYMDGGEEIIFEYDDEGFIKKEKDSYADMDGQDVTTNVFTITERDEHDNWTRRVNQHGREQTRVIKYFDE